MEMTLRMNAKCGKSFVSVKAKLHSSLLRCWCQKREKKPTVKKQIMNNELH
jgi:hypothetical protein